MGLGPWIATSTGPLYGIAKKSLPASMQMQKDELRDRYSEILVALSEEAEADPEKPASAWLAAAKKAANDLEKSRKKATSLDVRPARGSYVPHGLEPESSIDPEGGGKLGGFDRDAVSRWREEMIADSGRYDRDKLTPEKVLHYIENQPPAEQSTLLLFFFNIVEAAAESLSRTQEDVEAAIGALKAAEENLDIMVRVRHQGLIRATARYAAAIEDREPLRVISNAKEAISIARTELATAEAHAQPGSGARRRIHERLRVMMQTDYGLHSLRSAEIQEKLRYLKSRMRKSPGEGADAGYSREDIRRVFGIHPSEVEAVLSDFRRHVLQPPASSGGGQFRYRKRRGR